MNIKIAYSPCPNDTFIFDALVHNKVKNSYKWDIHLADISELNQLAFQGDYDVIKVSFHAYAYMTDEYNLLPVGSALGKGVGPLLISKEPKNIEKLSGMKVGIPGEFTTANFLFDFAKPHPVDKQYMLFSEIEDAVLSEKIDAGVIIHENRFTYDAKGLYKIVDLGSYWEKKTNLPIPLGGIAIRKSIDSSIKEEISSLLQQSIEYAYNNPASVLDYVKDNAQALDVGVMQKHIDLYVNEFTMNIGDDGKKAIDYLLEFIAGEGKIKTYDNSYMLKF